MSAVDTQSFPRGALMAAGAVITVSICVAGFGRYERLAEPARPSASLAPAARAIDLTFADEPNGAVLVRRAGGESTLAIIPPNSGGFLRGVLRGLTRERAMRGIGAGPAFRLSQWTNGHLEIQDLGDGETIDLDAFGRTNRDAFLHLLPGGVAS